MIWKTFGMRTEDTQRIGERRGSGEILWCRPSTESFWDEYQMELYTSGLFTPIWGVTQPELSGSQVLTETKERMSLFHGIILSYVKPFFSIFVFFSDRIEVFTLRVETLETVSRSV